MRKVLILCLVFLSSTAFANPLYFLAGSGGTGGPGAASYSDNFNRADVTPLGPPWVVGAGFNTLKIESNVVKPSDGTSTAASAIYDAVFSDNQYSEAKIITINDSGPAVRVAKTGGVQSGYMLSITATTSFRVLKFVAGSPSVVAGSTVSGLPTITGSDVFRISVSGTSISVYRNGALVSGYPVSDASITSGYPGMISRHGGVQLDDWAGGDL